MTQTKTAPLDPARTNWAAVLMATFAGATVALQIGKAAASLPLLRDEFGADVTSLALFVSLVSIVAAVAGMAFGLLTRRIGLRRAALIGLGGVAAGSATGAMAHDLPALLGSRFIEALGFALCTTSLPVLVQRATAPHEKSLTLGVWATWLPVGIAIAMALAFFTLDSLGWRGMFWLSALLPLMALLGLFRIIPAGQPIPATQTSGQLRQVLRPRVVVTAAIFVMFSAANLIVVGFLPTLLVDDFGISSRDSAVYLFFSMLLLLPLNVLTGRLMDAGCRLWVLLFGAFLIMGVASFTLYAPVAPPGLRLACLFLFTLATGVPPAVIWASTSVLARSPQEGPLLSGLFYQGAGIGQVAGPIAAGLAVEYFHGWAAAAWVTMGCIITALLLSLIMARLKPSGDGPTSIRMSSR